MTEYDKFRLSLTKKQIQYLDSPDRWQPEKAKLQLSDDIYSYTYLKMITTDDPLLHRELVLKCVLCFALQGGLIYLIFNDPMGEETSRVNYLEVNLARFVTAILLHIVVMPECTDAINMMQYSINNYENFKTQSFLFPFLIALMKLLGAFLTELLNMVVIISSPRVDDVVKDFIAFAIIAEIDDILGKTLKSVDKKDSVENQEVIYDKK
jgi:hypothetical protein